MREVISALCELAVLALFVLTTAGIFAASCGILGRGFKSGWKHTKLSFVDRCILLVGFAGLICVGYGFTEPFKLETTHISIRSKKLAPRSRIRIALIADLHCDGIPRVEKKLVLAISEQKPDLILFAGDAAHNQKGLQDFKTCMTELSKIAPVYAVDGNHDSRSSLDPDFRYEGTGAHRLSCASALANIRGNLIWIGGVAVDNERCMLQTLNSAPPDSFSIFLYHFPEGIKEASACKIDLFCTGHTHGGQIRLPWYGAIVTMSASGKKFEWGYYKIGDTSMYVNRGIGMTGLPVRFLAPPELTLIDLEAEQ